MNTLLRLTVLSVLFAGIPALAQDSSYLISGFVNTVGSNHGTVIDGVSSGEDVDRFEIRLRFDFDQTPPSESVYGGGFSSRYKLHETEITIQADGGPLVWSYSYYPEYAMDHGIVILDNYLGTTDVFAAGVDDGVLSGSLINGQILTMWSLNLRDEDGTVFSDTSLPELVDLSAFEARGILLGFGIEGLHPNNLITMEVDSVVFESAGAIPEPSTYAAIFGGVALGFAGWARRRSRQV